MGYTQQLQLKKLSRFKATISAAYLLASLQITTIQTVQAGISCSIDFDCETSLRPGSRCISGSCSNPFEKGCLRTMRGEDESNWPEKDGFRINLNRICNSDDAPDAGERGICNPDGTDALLDYMEIRIAPGDWESAVFNAWVIQILLSELLDVPVTIETAGAGGLSFYDPTNSFAYPSAPYNWDALKKAHEVQDCRDTDEICAHVLPEVWDGQVSSIDKYAKEGVIENAGYTGYLGRLDFYIPIALVEKEPDFASFYGLRGEENRKKLAETFKRPTTWLDYCNLENATCDESDDVAKRWPNDESEEGSYFLEGVYTGYFRATEANDCTNSKPCTGHVVKPPCGE